MFFTIHNTSTGALLDITQAMPSAVSPEYTISGFDAPIPDLYYNQEAKTVSCIVPMLSGVLTEGEKDIQLEIVVDGKLFVPLKESVMLEAPLKITSKLVEESAQMVEEEIKPQIKISLARLIAQDAKKNHN